MFIECLYMCKILRNKYFIFNRIDSLKSKMLEFIILTLFLHTQNTALGDILYIHYFLTLLMECLCPRSAW